MQSPARYSIHSYDLPEGFIQSLTVLHERKGYVALAMNWMVLAFLVFTIRHLIPENFFWMVYIPTIILIASRYGVFLQLIHEGSHGLLSQNKTWNHFIAKYLCSLPIGIQFDGYARGHIRHHAFTNTEKDPKSDTEKYRIVDFRNPRLYLLFLKDLLGITALSIFFQYDEYDSEAEKAQGHEAGLSAKLIKLAELSTIQLLVLGTLFQFSIVDYILLWLVPAISPHMFLMRIRGIAEHGLAKQLGITEFRDGVVGTFYTRSFLTPRNRYSFSPLAWFEKLLIGSLNVYYHHEHHLLPYVPYYNLPKLHQAIGTQIQQKNPDVFAKGYFAAAMRNLGLTPHLLKNPSMQSQI